MHLINSSEFNIVSDLDPVQSYLGALVHKIDVVSHYGFVGPVVEVLFTNNAKYAFLVRKHPELIPEPESPGQEPNGKHVAACFNFAYYSTFSFKKEYLDCLPDLNYGY